MVPDMISCLRGFLVQISPLPRDYCCRLRPLREADRISTLCPWSSEPS